MKDQAPRSSRLDDRKPIDPRIDTAGREGLTGTAPATLYASLRDAEHITIPPDGGSLDQQPAWRQDFPIDWPQDQYVERRDFMKFVVLTSFALAMGQFWIAGRNWWRRRRGLPEMKRIVSLAALPVGGQLTFTFPGPQDDCVMVRTGDDTLVAYSQRCTHLSCAVRPLVEQGTIECPCHDGLFDLHSGRPLAGPPRRPLDIVRLERHGDDIYAVGVEARVV